MYLKIQESLGPFDIDLFASALNAKCKNYVSWFPDSWIIDALTFTWTAYYFYAFPPSILLPKVFRKILNDKAEEVLVVLIWPSQAWFSLFRGLLIIESIIFVPSINLVTSPFSDHYPAWKNHSMAVGILSGKR